MTDVSETFDRTCNDCGQTITITVFEDNTYEGGHYWDTSCLSDSPDELWECTDCTTIEDDL